LIGELTNNREGQQKAFQAAIKTGYYQYSLLLTINLRCDYVTFLLFPFDLQCKVLQSKHTVNKINKDRVLQKAITRIVSYTETSEPLEMSII